MLAIEQKVSGVFNINDDPVATSPAHGWAVGRTPAPLPALHGLRTRRLTAVITALAARGSVALWGGLAGATLVSTYAVAAEKDAPDVSAA